MELAVDCMQGGAVEAVLSLWADFTSIVSEVPTSDDDGDGGWVQTRREVNSCKEIEASKGPVLQSAAATGHATLNLNLPPERRIGAKTVQAMRGVALNNISVVNMAGSSRGLGRGTGRGIGHVRRPPPVDPRYHTSASLQTWIPLPQVSIAIRCVCM